MPAPLLALPLLAKIGLGASALQGIMGGVQSLTSGAKRNERELERMAGQSPTYSGSRELEGFYNEALRRYQQSPYQSAKFIMGRNLAERSQANALGALTQRNSALAGAGRLASVGANQANQLVAQAEAERRQDFGMLGQAGRSLAQDKLTQFDINQMTPYNRKFGLQQMKTQAANERKNAGIQMIGNALSNAASIGMSGIGNEAQGQGINFSNKNLDTSPIQAVTRNVKIGSAPTSMNPNAKPLPLQTMPAGYGVLQKFKKKPFVMPF
ncbi:MAG: hypothetical protein IM591_13770 [Chitinophagaceae bacterium]|jgi:hypothetical protein|uniref:hypothetical protein n=1 Tax=Microcystis sp. M061S2 TaxID=2771171 RepID=UPI002589B243|nr:hypothetical protein [Microcystis sp. M061S2]MCA2653984.1 hypothetical protein [Microcystis sp. M061S2]MCA6471444.1 hypothetical protein [Chitinophagaceae bacterium]